MSNSDLDSTAMEYNTERAGELTIERVRTKRCVYLVHLCCVLFIVLYGMLYYKLYVVLYVVLYGSSV